MTAELALNVFCFVCGLVIVYRCGEHVDMMRWSSNHAVRIAYWALSVGGAALVFSVVSSDEWLRPLGWICVVSGVALLCVFDKRRVLEHSAVRRAGQQGGPTGTLGGA